MTRVNHRPLALALLLSALCHGVVLMSMAWLLPTPAPRAVVLRHVARRPPLPERYRAATAALPSASAWSRQRESTMVVPDVDATQLPESSASVDSLYDAPAVVDVGQPGQWQELPAVALPPPGLLPAQSPAMPLQGPQMLADMAERKSFALIDPETGKLLKAWLYLVANGNCGSGSSAAHRLEQMLTGMKRGQASARDLPMEFSVESLPCGQVLQARDLPRHRVILTDFIGVESSEALARHLAAGGFAMTSLAMLHDMQHLLPAHNVQLVQLTAQHPLLHAFFDIDAYTFENMAGVPRPLTGLEIDGRIAAIGGLGYRQERTSAYSAGGAVGRAAMKPHLSNLLYINAMAYGLVQPSALGGRYVQAD